MSKCNRHSDSGNGLWGGVVLLCIGLFFLLRRMDISLPDWLFSWEMVLIVIGFLMGIKNKFQGAGWFVVTAVGAVFLLDDIMPFSWHLDRYMWPTLLIVLGVYLIGRSASRRPRYPEYVTPEGGAPASEDVLQVTSIFSGNNKTVLSKNFKGGSVTSIFGGVELNFMQADIQGEVVLDMSIMFGAVELTVPANWDVKMDVNTIFGGIEDKRSIGITPMPGKLLVLRGSCTFGGVEIKSY
ncbi:LiaF transmembrane domain-containing protein [Chitinophaga cymbidii]|uniref:LiaF transmembrane domain-containing protein n=1 Tax=Chitinophaga cymbidii TaxID=1096750 RepID=A0A512RE83_9BACT|nr:DUF5668 domain-containing protein [Chitinophaga cymbidii]GEP93934.1 hypothetical protein CCY01nite_01940 [Chitinophaga cymbidii]